MSTRTRRFRKPSNCLCPSNGPGTYKQKMHHWRRLSGCGNGTHYLKCLECGWKWTSNRIYARSLPEHAERSRSGMTDEHILTRLLEFSLIVNTETAHVVSIAKQYRATNLKVIHRIDCREGKNSTYRFVKISYQGMQKKIALHRLVWMAHHRRLVPEGYDIDHIRGTIKRINLKYPDSIGNLRKRRSDLNRADNDPIPF